MNDLKFKLTSESKVNAHGVTLFRIEATVDIAARGVKKGDKGGWLESERLTNGDPRISENAWVDDQAEVSGNASVYGNAHVFGSAHVYGDARLYGGAWIYGNARVYGDARVSGNALLYGNAWVSGYAKLSGYASVSAEASFTRGWFIGGDNSGKITDITKETGSSYWENQYVLGDYEITPIKDKVDEKPETINIGGVLYDKHEVENKLKDIKSVSE